MNDELNQVISDLESGTVSAAAERSGLSESDVSAVRNSPLWRLRQQMAGRLSGDSDAD